MTTTVDEVLAELTAMASVTRTHSGLRGRLLGSDLTVRYEMTGDDDAVRPYLLRVTADEAEVVPATTEAADIVIRAHPHTLHRLISGDLGGREAIASGLLDIRRAPSVPKLLVMRALFNTYRKALRRGEIEVPSHG